MFNLRFGSVIIYVTICSGNTARGKRDEGCVCGLEFTPVPVVSFILVPADPLSAPKHPSLRHLLPHIRGLAWKAVIFKHIIIAEKSGADIIASENANCQ